MSPFCYTNFYANGRYRTKKAKASAYTPKRQRGITLIESLIAMVVAAMGILGILGVQMRTLTDTTTTLRRAQAIRLVEDFGERLKVNPNAVAMMDNYVSDFSNVPTPSSCSTGCNKVDQAKYDLAVWKQGVANNLPMGQARIFIPAAEAGVAAESRRQLGVMISWRENERADITATEKKNIDATQVRDTTSGNLISGAGSAATCPADRTCHLQFILLSARCAPYKPGSGAVQFFCAGS